MQGRSDPPSVPPATALDPNEVQPVELCGVRLPAAWPDEEMDALAAFVSPERRERIRRFRRREDRMRSLLAELLARWLLARRLGIAPADIRFARNRYGKPACVNGPAHFNLSHSGDWVVAAVSPGEIGVDVERIDPGMDLSLADSVFTPAERAWLDADVPGRRERFFELWTYKESFVKCAGSGLSMPLASFSIVPRADGTATVEPHASDSPGSPVRERYRDCRLRQFPIDGHKLAVCSLGPPLDNAAFRELSLETLTAAFIGRHPVQEEPPVQS